MKIEHEKYYNGYPLLNKLDLNKKKPELFLVAGNRSSGKTTFFLKYMIDRFLKDGSQFGLQYRWKYEIDSAAQKIFTGVESLFYRGMEMTQKPLEAGIEALYLDDKLCGFAWAINSASNVKKFSHFMENVQCYFMDEFQDDNNKYCPDEVSKFLSIHTSIARGKGKQVRYVPVIMASNNVTVLNPYYTELGITSRIRKDTKYMRGDGFVAEFNFNLSASEAMKESGINRAFSNNIYVGHAAENVYLSDNGGLIERPPEGTSRYFGSLKYNGKYYGVRIYPDTNQMYINKSADLSYPVKIIATTDDMEPNVLGLREVAWAVDLMRKIFSRGKMSFSDLETKEAVINSIRFF